MRSAFALLLLTLCQIPLFSGEEKQIDDEVIRERVEVIGKVELRRSQQSVTVIDMQELQPFAFPDLKSLYNLVPGMLALTSGHPGQFAYSFARGAAVNQQLFLLDGVKLQDPSSSLGANFTLLSTRFIDKIEIVRGPLSNLYGSSAMGGAINLVSRKESGISTALLLGSHGTTEASVHAGSNWHNLSASMTGSLLSYSDGADNDRYNNRGFSASGRFDNGKVQAGITLLANRVDCGIPFYLGSATPQRRYRQDDFLLAVPVSLLRPRGLGIEFNLNWQQHRYGFADPLDAWGPYNENSSSVLEMEAKATSDSKGMLRLTGGFDISFRGVSGRTRADSQREWSHETVASFFSAADFDLDRVLGTISVRFDRFGSLPGVWSPQIAASWNMTPRLKLRGSFSRSFRAPSLPERLNPLWGNPELRAERGQSFEFGVDTYFRKSQFGLTWFSSRYTDLIGYSPLTWRFANINRARAAGLEASGFFLPFSWCRLRLAYTHLRTLDLQYERRLLRRPDDQFSAVLQISHRGWSLTADTVFVGKRLDYDEILWNLGEIGSFTVFNVACRVPLRARLSFVGRVSNLADRKFSEVLGYPAPGRRFSLGIEYAAKK